MCELVQIAVFITSCVIQILDNNYSSKAVWVGNIKTLQIICFQEVQRSPSIL